MHTHSGESDMSATTIDWTQHDTEICEKAEASGLTINKETRQTLSIDDLDILAQEYDQVRSKMTVDEFFNNKLTTKPFEF